MNGISNNCEFNYNKNVSPFRWSLRFTFWKLFQEAQFWFVFFFLFFSDHCWLRTSGCLHGRALDMVICVALYQGLQIFAGRFGGKCLDQCKHCRPQRNPRGSKDHFRTPALSYCHFKETLNLCQTGWAHWRDLWGSKSWKDLDSPTWVSFIP